MNKILLSLTLLIVSTPYTQAQSSRTDSLLRQLAKQKDDTAKIRTLFRLGLQTKLSSIDSGRMYLQQAGALSKKLNDEKNYYKYLAYYADLVITLGKYDSALIYDQEALKLAEKLKDSVSIGISLFNIGIVYRETGQPEKAIEYLLKGRPIIERKGDKFLQPQLNDALQLLYRYRGEYDKGIEYGRLAVEQSRKLGDQNQLSICLVNLATNYAEKKDNKTAEKYLEESLAIGRSERDTRIIAFSLQNLGAIALTLRDYNKVRKYEEEVLTIAHQMGATDAEALALRSLGVCDMQQGRTIEAKEKVEKALALHKANDDKDEEATCLRILAILAYMDRATEKGLDLDDSAEVIRTALIKETMSKTSAELEKKYETEKKETRIKELEAEREIQTLRLHQKNIINYILVAGAGIAIILAWLFYRGHKHKQAFQQQRINELETEKQLAATEAVLKGEEQERTRLAKDLHDGLGGMLSGIKYAFNNMKGNLVMTPGNMEAFDRSMDMLDGSIKEMRRVAHNLMPEALVKFGLDTALKDFCNDIDSSGILKLQYQSIGLDDTPMDPNIAITLYRIVQELVNNILKHAKATAAIVQVTRDGDNISVTVEDDGKGFDPSILQQARGIGWDNIRSRVEYLKGQLDVRSAPGTGTSVLIELKTQPLS